MVAHGPNRFTRADEQRFGTNVRRMVNVWLLTFAYVWVQLNELWNLYHMPNRPKY